MLRELNKNFQPKEFGCITMAEVYQINKALCLDEMDALQLQNLRDFTVMYFEVKMGDKYDRVLQDKMSAIVAVIDQKKWNIGAEV